MFISCAAPALFMRIAKYIPAGPPPMMLIFIALLLGHRSEALSAPIEPPNHSSRIDLSARPGVVLFPAHQPIADLKPFDLFRTITASQGEYLRPSRHRRSRQNRKTVFQEGAGSTVAGSADLYRSAQKHPP